MSPYIIRVGQYALSRDGYHIVYFGSDEIHFTLAIFRKGSEGYNLEFVGARPFEHDWTPECTFMEFARACQKYLDGVFALEKFQVAHA